VTIFVWEHFTAQGLGRDPASPYHGIYREGLAMRDAIVADLRAIAGVQVLVSPDDPIPATPCWQLLIAPESDDVLANLAAQAQNAGYQLLGPSVEAIRLTGDKLALAEHWRQHGVPTPATTDRQPTGCEVFPVVWKPLAGAGSVATFLLNTPLDVARAQAQRQREHHTGAMILQQYVPGRAVSVAFLCGPAATVPLQPTFQRLSNDGRFHYEGGELPIPPHLAERALALGQRAIGCVPGLLGYVGVDLVLGEASDGSQDYAIELNPRLTTSYVGLRALAEVNLAEVLVAVVLGRQPGPVRWKAGLVRFAADGAILAK
jgi:predicted ATP-grasp superfamily ATP-dependent carboligase